MWKRFGKALESYVVTLACVLLALVGVGLVVIWVGALGWERVLVWMWVVAIAVSVGLAIADRPKPPLSGFEPVVRSEDRQNPAS